jgi:hypothetical protein
MGLSRWLISSRKAQQKWFQTFSKATKGGLLRKIYNIDETGFQT